MGKQNSSSKKGSCLGTGLMILAAIVLFGFLAGFGWIAGAVWLIFFRKKMSSNPVKQKKYTIGVSIVSALSLSFFIYSMVAASPSPTALTLSSPLDGQTLEINSDYTINVQCEPKDASLSAIDYSVNNLQLASVNTDPDNSSVLTLHTKGEGQITVTAKKGEIESNALKFEIVDSVKVEQEKEAEVEKLRKEEEKAAEERTAKEAEEKAAAEQAAREAEEKRAAEEQAAKDAEEEKAAEEQAAREADQKASREAKEQKAAEEQAAKDAEEKAAAKQTAKETAIDSPEAEPAPAPQSTEEPAQIAEAQVQEAPISGTAYLSATGSKYHSIDHCGKMNPNKARKTTISEAEAAGYERCSKCW